ncbi:hypothetical protein [Acinetobacter sp.]|uniref:hypothetical protein n=1 Tax=Acinetobacter sp. TaxID=472 RepID=UPI002FD9AF66
MGTKSIPIENHDLPNDDFAQDHYIEDFQDSGNDFNQDTGYDEFAQYEHAEIVKPPKKKR